MYSGLELMIQSTDSLHGGVVKEPMYLYTVLLARCNCRALKYSGPVSVALLGRAMAEMEEKTEARKGSVGPSSMRKATTAMDLSVSGVTLSEVCRRTLKCMLKFCFEFRIYHLKLTAGFENKM